MGKDLRWHHYYTAKLFNKAVVIKDLCIKQNSGELTFKINEMSIMTMNTLHIYIN